MDKDLALVLVGAGIAAATGILTSLIQHALSLRVDRTKRERDKQEKQAEEIRQMLMEGVREGGRTLLVRRDWFEMEAEEEEEEEEEQEA